MARGDDPRRLLAGVLPPGSVVPQDIDRMTLWKVGGGEPRGPWTVLKGIITFMRYSVQVLFNLLSEPERREKLHNVNTLEDVVSTSNGVTAIPILPMSHYPCPQVRLIQSCSRVLVLTGAGVSVSCGIPDFRSKDGVYAR